MSKEAVAKTETNWERHKEVSDDIRQWIHTRIDSILDKARSMDFEDTVTTNKASGQASSMTSGQFSISYVEDEVQIDESRKDVVEETTYSG